MPLDPLLTPALNASASDMLDWLELSAFFSGSTTANTDALLAALEQQQEEEEEDIGEHDRQKENLIAAIEEEFDIRSKDGGEHYPFMLSDDAEELLLVRSIDDLAAIYYYVCLLSSHLVASPIIAYVVDGLIEQRLRNRVFQIVSTLALAGVAQGPAVSIGWPRTTDETILDCLRRASEGNAGLRARGIAHPDVRNPHDKDGGMDIIAWRSANRPPPIIFYFGQVASGRNWSGKSAKNKVDSFKAKFIEIGPMGNVAFATLTPLRIFDEPLWNSQSIDHGSIVDRTMLPALAAQGAKLAKDGVMVDEAENLATVVEWIRDYKAAALS